MSEEVILSKIAHAFRPDAQFINGYDLPISYTLSRYQQKHGGFWISGKLSLTKTAFIFQQNIYNDAFHLLDKDLVIALNEVKAIERRFGLVAGYILIATANAQYKLRCFGAKTVVAKVQQLMSQPAMI